MTTDLRALLAKATEVGTEQAWKDAENAVIDAAPYLLDVVDAARTFDRSPAAYAGTFTWEERKALGHALAALDAHLEQK